MMVKNKTNESGRSMVEMLGVLAIVGVLSVGGVYGYGVAMKKHKANELLHQASMLATTISAQAMSNDGKLPETITSFGNSNYGKFSTSVGETADKTGFTITIENVDSAVCDQLKKGGMVQKVECKAGTSDGKKNAEITYYKNLATNPAEGEKSPTGEDTEKDLCADVECEEGLTCFHGQCKCPSGALMCGDQCCAEGMYCSTGEKTNTCAPTYAGECAKNSDCDEGEYCKFSDYDVIQPSDGSCTMKEELTEYTLKLPAGDLKVYKGGFMVWWSAQNLCAAHGKQMVTMADLGIQDAGSNTECFFDKAQPDYVSKPCICSGGDSDCSQTTSALFTVSGATPWLADNSKSKGTQARFFYGGHVSEIERNMEFSALCR